MIQTYKPTASLAGSERTRANYYQAIKTFFISNEYIGKYLELESATDDKYTFTLKTKSSLGLSQSIIYNVSGNYHIWRSPNSSTGNNISYNVGKDTVFTIIDLPDHILVLQDNSFAFSVVKTTSFDGKRSDFALIIPNSANGVQAYKSAETTYCMYINGSLMTECTGYSNTYVLEKLFLSTSDLICNSVYIARGGISIPPSGMSTIGGRRFYRLFSTNIMFLVE